MLRRALRPSAAQPLLLVRSLARSLSSGAPASPAPPSFTNPLLGISVPGSSAAVPSVAVSPGPMMASYEWHKLPVSHNKLRLVAKLASGLYWREAMLQLEFCRKTIAVHVKNTIEKAVESAEAQHGLNPSLLVVHAIRTGKGKYVQEIDYKAKGRAGMRSKYQANLTVILKQVTPAQIQMTRYYQRWRTSAKLMALPWEERVRLLPRFKSVEGYEPGTHRVEPVYANSLTVDARSSRELREGHRMADGESRWTYARGHPGPERGIGSGRGYNSRMNPWQAVGTPKQKVKPRNLHPVCGGRKRKVRRA